MTFPTITLSSMGGRIAWGDALELAWSNSVAPGCQLMGQPYWGWTTIAIGSRGWFFGM
jgi:hypothetical protein